jgi:hypothetical protein
MEEPAETKTEWKEGRGAWTYVYWVGGILLLYVLSVGPGFRIMNKVDRRTWNFLDGFHTPIEWAYAFTPLRKPLGMYFHLWVPEVFDKNGNPR